MGIVLITTDEALKSLRVNDFEGTAAEFQNQLGPVWRGVLKLTTSPLVPGPNPTSANAIVLTIDRLQIDSLMQQLTIIRSLLDQVDPGPHEAIERTAH